MLDPTATIEQAPARAAPATATNVPEQGAPGAAAEQPPTPTGKLCDPCDPYQPRCSEPGGLCVLNIDTNESFCGKACDDQTPCPSGYVCADVQVPKHADPSTQCVPTTLSCES